MDPQHGLKLDLVLRGLWELLKSLNKGIPCYGLTRNFLVGRLGTILGGFLEGWDAPKKARDDAKTAMMTSFLGSIF